MQQLNDNFSVENAGKKIMLFLRKYVLRKINLRKIETFINNFDLENDQYQHRYLRLSEFNSSSKIIYDANNESSLNSFIYINDIEKNNNFTLCSFIYFSESNIESNCFIPEFYDSSESGMSSFYTALLYNGKIANICKTSFPFRIVKHRLNENEEYFTSTSLSKIILYNNFGNIIGKCINNETSDDYWLVVESSNISGKPNIYLEQEEQEYDDDTYRTYYFTTKKLLSVDWL